MVEAPSRDDDISPARLSEIADLARPVIESTPSFELRLGRPGAFAEVVIMEVLDGGAIRPPLNMRLLDAVPGLLRGPLRRAVFLPHVSIARFRSQDGLAELKETLSHLRQSPPPEASFQVREVQLISAHLSAAAPTVWARWPLRPGVSDRIERKVVDAGRTQAARREREYANERIVVTWEPKYCIHTAMCLMGLPDVFDAARRPWVEIDAAEADDIAEVVMRCPTGALHFRRLDGGAQEPAPAETTVQSRKNGPLFVRGHVRVTDASGNVVREDTRVAFCRCGGSVNKPYCDGTHKVNGFVAE